MSDNEQASNVSVFVHSQCVHHGACICMTNNRCVKMKSYSSFALNDINQYDFNERKVQTKKGKQIEQPHDWQNTIYIPFSPSLSLSNYNDIVYGMCIEKSIVYVNIFDAWSYNLELRP